ncbi:endonuclease domain-containing protein [Novosphingobium sp.]|uniref:endonuclease domain-containing protein n=1 Tax=Novosphingobium sp. TaxID=1874826 RepID=UPI0035B3216A
MENHTPASLILARRLRREMSLPEGLLWQQLRGRPRGVKFRSQHPIGSVVVDFYSAKHRLVVEIDGISHDMGDKPLHDVQRDAWLSSLGNTIVRIAATDVLRNPEAVAESIVSLCLAEPPPSALRAATSPKGGDSAGEAN